MVLQAFKYGFREYMTGNMGYQFCSDENLTTILPETSADAIMLLQGDIAKAVTGHT